MSPSGTTPLTEPIPVGRLSSFGTRLLLALVGLVVIVAGTMLLLIGRQTAEQVRITTDRAAEASYHAFEEVEELHRAQLARLALAFTDSRHTLAALEAALESGDREWLVQSAQYELLRSRAGNGIAAFTDAYGDIVTTLVNGEAKDGDLANVSDLAREALETADPVATSYRVIDGRLFALTLQRLELAGRPVGTVTYGVPVDEELTEHIGQIAGVKVCFVAGDSCLAGGSADTLGVLMAIHSRETVPYLLAAGGRRWVLMSDEIDIASEPAVRRVIGVPIDEVIAPFERIRSVVVWTGLAALALAFGLAVILSERLSQPVRELMYATRRIARGDLQVRVPVRRRDELGALAGSFNTMAEDLALKERYHDVLRKVVSPEVANDLISGKLQLGGEARHVTVLFADIVGFTTIAEGEPPREVITLLNECMTEWSRAVEEEGGVVDKYIGDAVMAIFGAPVSHEDDAWRAVKAAVRMREMASRIRTRTGQTVELAIGISTGEAIAGNMGSPDRLNYTVVGESVNLAARLCAAAGAGEILLSLGTKSEITPHYGTTDLGERHLKGLTRPVGVYRLDAAEPARPSSSATLALLAAVLLATAPSFAASQQTGGGLPTLAGLGISYLSPSGAVQIDFSGRLDVEWYLPQDSPAWLIPTTDPFVAGRLRLLTDVFLGDHLYSMVEIRADRGEAPADGDVEVRLEQIFLRFAPSASARFHVQAGKFALPFGSYAARHHTVEDPLIRPPLAYDYRTLVSATVAPAAQAGFLNWKNEAVMRRPLGSPQVWSVPYPWGAMLSLQLGPVAFRAAAMSAAASSAPEQWEFDTDRFSSPSWTAGAAVQLRPELRVGAAYHRGPFLDTIRTGALPAGTGIPDFIQEIWNAEFFFARANTTIRGELFLDQWEVPNLAEDPGDISWYIEARQKLIAGLFVAGRWSEIRFDELEGPSGAAVWDHDVRRFQLGAGYRLLRNTEVRAEYLINRTHTSDPRDNLFSLQWWWHF